MKAGLPPLAWMCSARSRWPSLTTRSARLFGRPNVILTPHLTFYTHEAMQRLEQDTLDRCFELLEGRPVRIKSRDPRLRAQSRGVIFG